MSSSVFVNRWLTRMCAAATVCLVACAPMPPSSSSGTEVAPVQPPLAVRSLDQGVQLYQSARYDAAETMLKAALMQGLTNAADAAKANKYLAFIYCTSKRESMCAAAFRLAREADPSFELSKTEAGHPLWGPVYRKAMVSRNK